MKLVYIISLSLFLSFTTFAQSEGVNVLFLGNSYIFTNDMPDVLDQLANSLGQPFTYEASTLPGYSLEDHTQNANTTSLIEEGTWDHVILQEQSQMPALPIDQVEANVFPYAESLVLSAREANACCMPIFLMTWGRENGDQQNCGNWPPVCTYEGQQELLTERYITMAEDNESWTAPVGAAWQFVREDTEDAINLYDPDGSHPSFAGTYLAACVLYAQMYGESPEGASYMGSLSEEDAMYLQEVAADITLEDSDEWNYHPVVWGEINFTGETPSYTAELDLSAAADSALVIDDNGSDIWQDGETNAYFFNEGTYYWVMEIYSECGDVSTVDSLVVNPPGVNIDATDSPQLTVYPNPAKEIIRVEGGVLQDTFRIVAVSGEVLIQGRIESENQTISIAHLPSGVYQMMFGSGRGVMFVKEE